MTCIVHEDVCPVCGEGVKGGSTNGELDIPVGGQEVICLICLFFGNTGGEAEAPTPLPALKARRDVRRGAGS
jgi:hypothetical protein